MHKQNYYTALEISDLLSPEEKYQIFQIWCSEYPRQSVFNTYKKFDDYICAMVNPTHYLVKDTTKKVLGWLVTVDRDNSRWLVILVHSDTQKLGLGSLLLNEVKYVEPSISAWITPHNNYFKADGSIYRTPLPFYLKNGFQLTDETFEKDDFSGTKIIWSSSPLHENSSNRF